jgi:hypothetical protein
MSEKLEAAWALALTLAAGVALGAQQPVNSVGLAVEHFEAKVKDYVALKNKAAGSLPKAKPTPDAAEIKGRQRALAQAIRQARPAAQAGDLFTPEIAAVLRRAVAADFAARTQTERHAAMKEVPAVTLGPNDQYPSDQPLATVPARLLQQLPRLPDGLEFRFVGHALILRDVDANLVVDILGDAVPRQ